MNGPLAADEPPAILQLTIETIKPGSEVQYGTIEERLAQMCARHPCPNNYLALESTTVPKEVWWLNAYASQAEVDRIAQAYERDPALLRELRELSAQKRDLTDEPVNRMTTRRPDLGDSAPWRIGAVPFAVIAEGRGAEPRLGAVFEAADGSRFTVIGATTRADAEAAAANLSTGARVFAVRASWSKPAQAWVEANPQLWVRR